MAEESLLQKARVLIESRIRESRRKFEILYGATKDLQKKSALQKMMDEIDRDLKKLEVGLCTLKDLEKYEISESELREYVTHGDTKKDSPYKILRNIVVEKLNDYSTNREINAIWSYLNYFGKEYLGLLSEQNLRLDYGHAYQRDQFFTHYHNLVRFIQDYGTILQQLESANVSNNREYHDRLIKAQSKEYRDVIIKTGQFLVTLQRFVTDIFESEKTGEKVLLEPDKIVEIKGEQSCIDGLSAHTALQDMGQFVVEFIDFIKIPDIKKIKEE